MAYEHRRLAPKQPRVFDAKYLSALRELPCMKCGHHAPSEAAHIRLTAMRAGIMKDHELCSKTGAGIGEKPHDRWALPLCDKCHRVGPEAEHLVGERTFYGKWGVDPHEIAYALYSAFNKDRRRGFVERMAAVVLEVRVFGFAKV